MEERGIHIKRTSCLWETEPMYVKDQDRFLNGVAEVETDMEPLALLDVLQSIEKESGRVKVVDKGPRNIDLDILLHGDLIVDHPRLKIPHMLMFEREFVLRPLAELIPGKPLDSMNPWKVTQDYLNELPQSEAPMSTVTPLSEYMKPLRALDPRRNTSMMAILNATPDSFSDGGRLLKGADEYDESEAQQKAQQGQDSEASLLAQSAASEKSDKNDAPGEKGETSVEVKREGKQRDAITDGPLSTSGLSDFMFAIEQHHRKWGEALATHAVSEHTWDAIWDVGGQSTAPGVKEVSVEEETKRVVDTIEEITDAYGNMTISVDTYRASVAEAAAIAGATIINDVSAGAMDPDMLPTMARLGVTVILMHMRGTPQTMSGLCDYPQGLIPTIAEELLERVAAAEAAGIRRWRIILDPGIGFAKTAEQNLEILRRFDELRDWPGLRGLPWLVGSSRKSFIGKITGVEKPNERSFGTAVTVAAAIQGGADIVRVHDFKEMKQVITMSDAIWRV
ncbi:trifunctional dihydropteroate synthetase [Cadophora gregata f. sp. sojae]|nr:trifunctional dihydropteroate synthetase [Cadophora gregata f. sp. sojae]